MANSATQFEPVDRAVVSLGAGEALFGAQAANFDWQTKSLIGGAGVSLSSDANTITITNTGDTANRKLDATAAPTANNDSAGTSAGDTGTDGTAVYTVGSFWYDVTNDQAYTLVDDTATAAVWLNTSQTASATNLAVANVTATTLDVTSSTGTNATLPAATTTTAGLMTDALFDNLANVITLTGVAADSTDLGTFTGTTITDNSTFKVAIQELETALEANDGVTTIAGVLGAAATTVNVAHGLGFTPNLQDVQITLNNLTLIQKLAVTAVDATNVTVTAMRAPGAAQNFSLMIKAA